MALERFHRLLYRTVLVLAKDVTN